MIDESGPEPAYRWVIVFASAAMLAVAMGMMVNGISVFFIPMNDEFGWQRGAIALINVSGLVGLAFGGIIMGRIADRADIRKLCLFGSTVFSLCILAASGASYLWQFYLLFFVAGFLGAGALFAPLIANVGNWFLTGAGLAVGIASAGQALGQGGVPFVTAVLINAFGWRGALFALGVFALTILIPLAMLLRQPPVQPASKTGDVNEIADERVTSLSTNTVIIYLSAAGVFCCTCMSVPLMHLVPLIQDKGYSLEQASSVAFLMLVSAIFGRVAFGKLADIIGAIPAYMIASLWQTVLVFMFTQFESLTALYIFAAVYGFGYAGVMTGILICVRVLVPISRRASALGVVLVFAWMGHGIGGFQGGYVFDLTGGYTWPFANAAMAGVINLIIIGTLYVIISRGPSVLERPA